MIPSQMNTIIRKGNQLEYNAPDSLLSKQTDPDHFYINLTYFNNNTSNTNIMNQTVPARISQTYDRDIISQPDLWNLSIVRFSISSDTVPRVTQPLGTTGGNTDLYVDLGYDGTDYTQPIVLPVYPNITGSVQGVYQVNEFLDLINAGYQAAQAEIALAGGPTGPTGQAAFISYDPTSGLYTMNSPSFYGTGGIGATAGNGVSITMSYQLYHKFQSFDVIQNDPILFNASDVTFVRAVRGDNVATLTYPSVGVTGQFLQLRQDAPWASSIEDIDRLLITSQFLPVVKEYKSEQLLTQYSGNQQQNGNQTLSIITDFFIGSDSVILSRSENFIYIPPIYRWCSLKGQTPIKQVDLQIYYADKLGNIFPLYVNPLDSFDVKILFAKKGLAS